jgi:hypothetical protein
VGQNYPNPVASPTQIEYHVRASGNVAIAIYDVDGRIIDVLLTTPQTQGSYTTTWAPREDLSNGTYFARLYVDGSHADVLKLTVQR